MAGVYLAKPASHEVGALAPDSEVKQNSHARYELVTTLLTKTAGESLHFSPRPFVMIRTKICP